MKQFKAQKWNTQPTETLLEQRIKKWYILAYPSDELGKELDSEMTFEKFWEEMKKGGCPYGILGGDSIVRERVFHELSNILNLDYMVIYNTWLEG